MGKIDSNNDMPFSFSGAEAVAFKQRLFEHLLSSGLDPDVTADWKAGIYSLFGVQTINLPDFEAHSYILSSNHISDFDAVILGLLHPRIRIIAKIGWASNRQLMDFLEKHYDIVGIYRDSEIEQLSPEDKKAARDHNYRVTIEALKYLKDGDKARHLLIFPQGTISDINANTDARINPGFSKIAYAAKAELVNVFIEYPGTPGPTRVICGTPYAVTGRNDDLRRSWLDGVIALQNSLDNLRAPVLSEKHLRNNSPDEPFFI